MDTVKKDRLRDAVMRFDEQAARDEVMDAIQGGAPVSEVIEALRNGMVAVGDKFREGEFFVTDLILAAEVMKSAQEILEPAMRNGSMADIGTVVVATVSGDVHDIGKNVFTMLLRAEGFKVIDLGVDASVRKIVDAVREHKPDILGLSALLTTNLEEFPKVVESLEREDLRREVKVLIGGATVTEQFAAEAGVDAYAKSAVDGVSLCTKWVKP